MPGRDGATFFHLRGVNTPGDHGIVLPLGTLVPNTGAKTTNGAAFFQTRQQGENIRFAHPAHCGNISVRGE